VTRRCRDEDLPELTHTKGIVTRFLKDQEPKSSGTESFDAREDGASQALRAARRAALCGDTMTFHAGDGRGVRWEDKEREVLWLCCTSDEHDGGYAHAIALLDAGTLYPVLDPAYSEGVACSKWGEHKDEDVLEWGRIVSGIVDAIDTREADLAAGETVDFHHAGRLFAQIKRDADGITSLRLRRVLTYPSATGRDRKLTVAELDDILAQLTDDKLAEEDYMWADWPYDAFWAEVAFDGKVVTPDEWIAARVAEAVDNQSYRLSGSSTGF
jgi:hypothetical protein